jgi:glutathione S-transferase
MSQRNVTKSSDITLYTDQTPNGVKISIALELLGLPYKLVHLDISKNTQKEPWFLEINPNSRIPAITDSFYGGGTISLFESGSILQYLVDEYDKDHKISYVRGTKEYYETNSWLFCSERRSRADAGSGEPFRALCAGEDRVRDEAVRE